MMLRHVMGTREIPIGMDEFLVKCPSCEGYSPADIMIVSKYLDFFWVPLFPIDKDANVSCKTCGLNRFGMNFDSGLITNYDEVKRKFRHPWFTYVGGVFFILMLIFAIFAALF
ncbi:MAG: zinc-ribbon domain-containing protein [Ginsengibacter sp.]